MSRKYRQQGYQDSDSNRERQAPSQAPRFREGPRSPRMPGMRRAVRCSNCGATIKTDIDEISYSSQCPKCSSDLHSCKNCTYFNPAGRFECAQPIPQRISPKDKRADCEFFNIRSTVEKIVTSSADSPDDARTAFENLFK